MTPKEFSKTTPEQRNSSAFYQEIFRDLKELEELRNGIEPAVLSMVEKLDSVCGDDICPNCGEFRMCLEDSYADCKHCGDMVPF